MLLFVGFCCTVVSLYTTLTAIPSRAPRPGSGNVAFSESAHRRHQAHGEYVDGSGGNVDVSRTPLLQGDKPGTQHVHSPEHEASFLATSGL